jgi:hypothetical protein
MTCSVSTTPGTFACDTPVAWSSDSARATALVLQNGVYVKSGATTRRYIGTFRTTGVSGQTEDSSTKRFVWNYYNRVRRTLARLETTASWAYNIAAFRQANASAANQIDVVIGVAESAIDLRVIASAFNNNGGTVIVVAIGEDSTTVPSASDIHPQVQAVANNSMLLTATLVKFPAVGRHFYAWLEDVSVAAAATTFLGVTGTGSPQSGIIGSLEN